MKKVLVVIMSCMIGFVALGQENSNSKIIKKDQPSVKYCAILKDGKTMVMNNKTEITSDITLESGIVIKRDGTVIRNDRSLTTLRIGECVDNETIIVNPKDNDVFNRVIDQNTDLAKSK